MPLPAVIRRKDFPDVDITDGRSRWPVVADSITDENRRLAVYREWLRIVGQSTYIEVSDDLWASLIPLPSVRPPDTPPPPPVSTPTSWPTAANTGVTGATVVSGLRRASQFPAGDIVGFAFNLGTDWFTVDRPTTFRNCKFTSTGLVSNTSAQVQNSSDMAVFEDCTFDGGPSHNRCIQGDRGNLVVKRCSFTRFGNAACEKNDRTGLWSMLVTDCYLYEPRGWPRADHADGLQMGGGKDFIARRNTIHIEPYGATDGDASYVSNSAIGLWAELGDVTGDVIIEGNHLAGGGCVMYIEQKAGFRFKGSVTVSGNVFDRTRFPSLGGNAAIWHLLAPLGLPSQLVWSGNTLDDGTAVTLAEAVR